MSHNHAQKALARLLAMTLTSLGEGVWLDDWEIASGESLTQRVAAGLGSADVFIVLWSQEASKSEWVRLEVDTYVQRIATDSSLRLVPIMLDDTPLSKVISDYKGIRYRDGDDVFKLALALVENPKPDDVDLAQLLQRHLNDVTRRNARTGDPMPILVCPSCGSNELKRASVDDVAGDETYYIIECGVCSWSDWTQ